MCIQGVQAVAFWFKKRWRWDKGSYARAHGHGFGSEPVYRPAHMPQAKEGELMEDGASEELVRWKRGSQRLPNHFHRMATNRTRTSPV